METHDCDSTAKKVPRLYQNHLCDFHIRVLHVTQNLYCREISEVCLIGRMAEIYSTTLFLSSTLAFDSAVSASLPEVSGMAAPL
jgi:hypothetical protein